MAARFFARSRAAYGRAPRRGGEAPRCAEAARSVVRASQPRRRDRARHRRERRRISQAGILRRDARRQSREADRKSGVVGKSVSVRVDLGGRRIIKKKNNTTNMSIYNKKY